MKYPYPKYEENSAHLDYLESVHRGFKKSLGRQTKSRQWAVWQLQGASLGLAYRAVKLQREQEDVMAILLMIRLSHEFLNQVNYFANPNTKSEAIKRWWKVYVPFMYPTKLTDIEYWAYKTRGGKVKHRHNKTKDLPKGIDFTIGQYHAPLNKELSLWMHPSYNLTRDLFETGKNQGNDYGYELYEFKNTFYHDMTANFAATSIVENAAKAMHLGSYLFGDPIDLDTLLLEVDRN